MELKDIVGEHMLDAVDFSNEQVKTWGDEFENCSVMRFRLDGVVYIATEEPCDGYRSSMKNIVTGNFEMKNTFQPVKVIGRHRTEGKYSGVDDVLELIDASTGKTVIEVGTDNCDDYYPSFVHMFDPMAMKINT